MMIWREIADEEVICMIQKGLMALVQTAQSCSLPLQFCRERYLFSAFCATSVLVPNSLASFRYQFFPTNFLQNGMKQMVSCATILSWNRLTLALFSNGLILPMFQIQWIFNSYVRLQSDLVSVTCVGVDAFWLSMQNFTLVLLLSIKLNPFSTQTKGIFTICPSMSKMRELQPLRSMIYWLAKWGQLGREGVSLSRWAQRPPQTSTLLRFSLRYPHSQSKKRLFISGCSFRQLLRCRVCSVPIRTFLAAEEVQKRRMETRSLAARFSFLIRSNRNTTSNMLLYLSLAVQLFSCSLSSVTVNAVSSMTLLSTTSSMATVSSNTTLISWLTSVRLKKYRSFFFSSRSNRHSRPPTLTVMRWSSWNSSLRVRFSSVLYFLRYLQNSSQPVLAMRLKSITASSDWDQLSRVPVTMILPSGRTRLTTTFLFCFCRDWLRTISGSVSFSKFIILNSRWSCGRKSSFISARLLQSYSSCCVQLRQQTTQVVLGNWLRTWSTWSSIGREAEKLRSTVTSDIFKLSNINGTSLQINQLKGKVRKEQNQMNKGRVDKAKLIYKRLLN